MLRNALLAGAAALALLPGIGSARTAVGASTADAAQTSPSETAGVATPGGSTTPYSSQIPGGSDTAAAPSDTSSTDSPSAPSAQAPDASAPDANRASGYYASGPTEQQPAPDTSGQTPPNAGASGMDVNRSGSAYTAQPPAAEQPSAPATEPQASATVTTASAAPTSSDQPVVVVPRQNVSAKLYVRRAAMADNYEIRAAKIALRRTQSDTTRQFANDMIQQHSQSTAILTQAANQANVPVDPSLDRAHKAMLVRLERAPASDFDRIYMNQQVTAHMNAASLHQGYAQNGDNPTLQQAAQQISPVVQTHLNLAWTDSGVPQRMAEHRTSELNKLAEAQPRGSTYRGYTVIGPTSVKQLRMESRTVGSTGYTDQYTGGGAAVSGQSSSPGAVGTPQYQGYTTPQPAPGAAPPGTATPGNPGTTNPNVTGTPQYQGYTSPGATTQPGTAAPAYPSTTAPGTTSPGYPNTAAPGTTTPGAPAPGTTSPGANPPGAASPGSTMPPQGSTGPG